MHYRTYTVYVKIGFESKDKSFLILIQNYVKSKKQYFSEVCKISMDFIHTRQYISFENQYIQLSLNGLTSAANRISRRILWKYVTT